MPNILAIDQSTSATKAILYDAAGALLVKASRSHQQIYPQPGWVEHDAEEICSLPSRNSPSRIPNSLPKSNF